MNYFISTRNIVKDAAGADRFGTDPGATMYLSVPETATETSPANEVPQNDFLSVFTGNQNLEDIVIFVHGFNNKMTDLMLRHKEVKSGLQKAGYTGEIISFDWPCNDEALLYLDDRHHAKRTALELVTSGITMLAKQQGNNCTINIHALAHSTGAYVIYEAFDDAETTSATAEINWTVSQLLFIAGDVSSDSMSDYDAASVYRHCNRFTNYFNQHDEVLAISNAKRVGFKNRVGRIGLPDDAPVKAVDINCSDFFDAHKGDIQVTDGAPTHSWYFYSDAWFQDAYQTIIGKLDRNVIPTREKGSDGKLKLKM